MTLLPTPTAQPEAIGDPDVRAARVERARAKHGRPFGESLSSAVAHLLPTPVSQPSGNTPEEHLRKKPGRDVVTDLSIIAENGLFTTGGRLLPTPMVGSTSPAAHGQISGDYRRRMDEALANFGPYREAIARWEHIVGRPAPAPTEPGKNRPRLAARFVEWMMGLPVGHVTAVPGLTRNQQLKALGNGVVPQQGAAAIAHLAQIRATR